jgi:hypothetical protein
MREQHIVVPIRVKPISQLTHFVLSEEGRFEDRPVLARQVRYEMKNDGRSSVIFVRTVSPVRVANDKYSESLVWSDKLQLQGLLPPACQINFIDPGDEFRFECTYPIEGAFSSEFAVAYDRPEDEEIDWININSNEPLLEELKWIRARIHTLEVQIPKDNRSGTYAPLISLKSSECIKTEGDTSEGVVEAVTISKAHFVIENRMKCDIVLVWTEPIRFLIEKRKCFTQSLAWPKELRLKRLPVLYTRHLRPNEKTSLTCEYGTSASYATDFAFSECPTANDLKKWESLNGKTTYADKYDWIKSSTKVIQVDVPVLSNDVKKSGQSKGTQLDSKSSKRWR